MARTTLEKVAHKAATQPEFWKSLRSDPDAALQAARLELAPNDLRKLKRMLKRKRVDVVVRIAATTLARSIPARGRRPRRTWPADIDWYSWPWP